MRLSNITGWTLAAYLFGCGEKLSLTTLVPLALLTAALLWFGFEVKDAMKSEPNHIVGAPIASAVSRDLGIDL